MRPSNVGVRMQQTDQTTIGRPYGGCHDTPPVARSVGRGDEARRKACLPAVPRHNGGLASEAGTECPWRGQLATNPGSMGRGRERSRRTP